ncbi:TRM11 family SAM-dependent methyltransferase [Caldinitratiruptor microaerophilus]|uniref:TRM11 family SAM-dependent methyltransferase n=1 Tax=Caldinitratiruptor microaerophilus TaxID=671077 RepID=UPI002230FF1F|nr:DNA methyltransferase [Caldinitratiruptor microaerophilus]
MRRDVAGEPAGGGGPHVDLGPRGVYHRGNRLNDLTGKEWLFSTRSVISMPFPPSCQFELRSQHGGQKPPELCAYLIRIFTKSGQRVLDPFMGVGGTLLGASLSGREAVGIEISPRWVDIYHEVCRREGLAPQTAIVGDSRQVLPTLEGPFDFLLTDVPYWDMDRRRRSAGKFKRAGEAARPRRPSKLQAFGDGPRNREEWLRLLEDVFAAARPLLRPRAYLAVFIGDMYHSGRFHPLSHEVAAVLDRLGYVMKGNLIWYDVSKSLHIYGYRYEFIPSMIHQNILIFRHEPGGSARRSGA